MSGRSKQEKQRLKKERRAEENAAKAAEMGMPLLAPLHVRQAEESQRVYERKFSRAMENGLTLQVPERCKLSMVEDKDPALFAEMASSPQPASKDHSLAKTEIIWYNELDRDHTFNRSERQCRSLCALVSASYSKGTIDKVSSINILHALAVDEAYITHDKFDDRTHFIEQWHQSKEDIIHFSNKETKRLNNIAHDMRKVLIDIQQNLGRRGGGDSGTLDVLDTEAYTQANDEIGDLISQLGDVGVTHAEASGNAKLHDNLDNAKAEFLWPGFHNAPSGTEMEGMPERMAEYYDWKEETLVYMEDHLHAVESAAKSGKIDVSFAKSWVNMMMGMESQDKLRQVLRDRGLLDITEFRHYTGVQIEDEMDLSG